MSYKTINITAIEYYRYTIILCIEYVNIEDHGDKLLQIIKCDEFANNTSNIFDFNNIPNDIQKIYEYSKKVSKVIREENIYYIFGQKVHKRDDNYYKLFYDDIDIYQKSDIEINAKNISDINTISKDESNYYYRLYCTIKLKCY